MSDVSELIERAGKTPPFFSLCRWGLHRDVQFEQFITTGYAVCIECGLVSMTSLFGEFPLSRDESVSALTRAASGMEAPSGGETVEQGSTEGDSPVAESETPPPSDLSTDKDG